MRGNRFSVKKREVESRVRGKEERGKGGGKNEERERRDEGKQREGEEVRRGEGKGQRSGK